MVCYFFFIIVGDTFGEAFDDSCLFSCVNNLFIFCRLKFCQTEERLSIGNLIETFSHKINSRCRISTSTPFQEIRFVLCDT